MSDEHSEKAGHCWHSTGMTLASNPPQHPEVCCFCGADRVRTYEEFPVEGHGPHLPTNEQWARIPVYRGGDEPCARDDPKWQAECAEFGCHDNGEPSP